MNVAAALRQARAAGVASLDAQLLLGAATGLSRTGLVAHDDRVLGADEEVRWSAWLARRAAGEPLAYLLGVKEFCGLRLDVTPDVLVPRPDTEVLADWAVEVAGATPGAATVLDLGTGSGAVALAIKHRVPRLAVSASDVSPAALAVARLNADRLGLPVEFAAGPWWSPWTGRRFDVVVANPPYIAADDDHLADLRHEPLIALTPGGDGLGALVAIVAGAGTRLHPGGWLLLEHGHDQGGAVRALLGDAGLVQVQTRRDLAGHERASGAQLPEARAADDRSQASRHDALGRPPS